MGAEKERGVLLRAMSRREREGDGSFVKTVQESQIPIPLLQKFTMWRLTENQDHQKKQICYYSLNYPISFYG